MNPTDPKPLGLIVALSTARGSTAYTRYCLANHADGFPDAVKGYKYKSGELIPIRGWCFQWTSIRSDLLRSLKHKDGTLKMIAEINRSGFRAVTERTLRVGSVEDGFVPYANYLLVPLDSLELSPKPQAA